MGEANQGVLDEGVLRTKEKESSALKIKEKLKRREEIFRDKDIVDEDQRLEMMQETDFERAQLILDDPKMYNEYQSQTDDEPRESLRQDLLEVISRPHYMLTPGMELFIAPSVKSENQISRLEFVSKRELKSGVLRFSLRIYEPFMGNSEREEHLEHVGVIDVDISNRGIRSIVIPEAISLERPRKLFPPVSNRDMESLKKHLINSFLQFIKIPEYLPQATTGRTVEPNENNRGRKPIEIADVVESTLMFRRRTIDAGHLDKIGREVADLVNSWSDDEKRVLKDVGGGNIRLQFFSRMRGESGTSVYTELFEKPRADDLQIVCSLIKKEINEKRASDVTIVCFGSWVGRKYKNLEPGTSPSAHLRRTPGKIILILNRAAVNPELRNLQEKINNQKELTKEDLVLLGNIIVLGAAQLNEIVKKGGIIFKDGSFSPHPKHLDIPKQVYYRKKDGG